MDKTILNLLFNYKGTVNYREFRAGIAILFMLMGTYLNLFVFNYITTLITAKSGDMMWLGTSNMYNQITNSFTPNLVPIWFIISYSSFVLAVKRVRVLTNKPLVAMAAGILNYLFFASIIALVTLEIYMAEKADLFQFVTPFFIYTIRVLFAIGLIKLIFLCIYKNTEQVSVSYQPKRLDASGYAIKIGKLMLISICASFVIGFVLRFLILQNAISYAGLQIISILSSLIILFFYARYSAFRLWDAAVSIWWLVVVAGIYCVLVGLKIWFNQKYQTNFTLYYNTLFAIATSFFVAAQYGLFLLPSKKEE